MCTLQFKDKLSVLVRIDKSVRVRKVANSLAVRNNTIETKNASF